MLVSIFPTYPVICGVAPVIGTDIPLLRETYAPIIRQRQAAKVGDPEKDVYDQPAAPREHGKLLLPLDQSLASFRHTLLKPDLFLAFT